MNILLAFLLSLCLDGVGTITNFDLHPTSVSLDFERWQRKQKTDDRDAEEVALLIALAQKYAEVLKASRFADDVASRPDERLHVFHVSRTKYRAILT